MNRLCSHSTYWWQLCHSHSCLGLSGRKSAVPWFFTRCGNRNKTLYSRSLTSGWYADLEKKDKSLQWYNIKRTKVFRGHCWNCFESVCLLHVCCIYLNYNRNAPLHIKVFYLLTKQLVISVEGDRVVSGLALFVFAFTSGILCLPFQSGFYLAA